MSVPSASDGRPGEIDALAYPDLAELLEVLGKSHSKVDLTWLGVYLARLQRRSNPYSYTHLLGCLLGHKGMRPGKRLRASVLAALAIAAEGVHPVQATHREQSLLVPPEIDATWAQLGIEPRSCVIPGCTIRFIPNTARRRKCFFHSPARIREEAI